MCLGFLNDKWFCLEFKVEGNVYFLQWLNTEDFPNLRIICIVLLQPQTHTAWTPHGVFPSDTKRVHVSF